MLTSDRNWYDEIDKSDQAALGMYESRLEGADSLREKRYISTPTQPNFGINKVILESDQKHWRFSCPKCGHRQHMEWPGNVSFERGCYVCSRCSEQISEETIRNGRFEAKYPGRSPDPITGEGGISGYLLTQMIAPWIKPQTLIDYYNDAQAGRNDASMEYFYNHRLGLPYVNASSAVSRDLIYRNLTASSHVEINSIMGVDVQERELYVILGTDEGVYGIIRVQDEFDASGKVTKDKWDQWARLMEIYDVRYCVIDGGYKPNDSIAAAKRFPGKVWVNWYGDDPAKEKMIRWSDDDFTKKSGESWRILTARNRAIDWLVDPLLSKGEIRFYFSSNSPAIEHLVKHVETTYARTVTDNRGMEKREWVSTGKDDFLHALVYYAIARERARRGVDKQK